MNLRHNCILFFLLAFAAPASAQDLPEPEQAPDIVVTGESLDRQVRDFVGALTQAPPRGQLSRFEWQVCPTAIGLPDSQKATVVNRMRNVAQAAAIPLGDTGCMPNVLVVVTRDKRAFIQALSRHLPTLFTGMPSHQRQRILREPRASAWHVQGPPLNGDGRPLEQVRLRDPITGLPSPVAVYMDVTTRPASRIATNARFHFTAAVVVVEADALEGLTTIQLADYAAMRSFAQTDPARLPASPPPTILSVLDVPMGGAVPITLTAWDLGFLRGLYDSSSNLFATSQRSEIRRQVNRAVSQ
jgi:hypothetical protein